MKICATLLVLLGAAPAFADPPTDPEEFAFVRKVFQKIQLRSFDLNRELCGYLGRDALGRLMVSQINVGQEAGCTLPDWPTKFVVLASFHTHSTYNPAYNSEVPSSTDMESDQSSQINGWIATPGGRVWFVDSSTMTAHQVCGVKCVAQDPNFIDEPPGAVKGSYSYRAIIKSETY